MVLNTEGVFTFPKSCIFTKNKKIAKMFEYEYQLYINGELYQSLFGSDYYFDKRVFNVHHGRVLFDIFQDLKKSDHVLTIVHIDTKKQVEIKTAAEFKDWVSVNNRGMEGFLADEFPTSDYDKL